MKKIILFFLSIQCCFGLSAQNIDASFTHDGILREYIVHLPTDYVQGNQLPVVLNLHGITSNASQQLFYSNFNPVSDTGNFIVVYPEGTEIVGGTGRQWNVNFPFSTNNADDVGFISNLIDTLHADYNINLDKVYVTGMSNGGYMAYKLACELTDKISCHSMGNS